MNNRENARQRIDGKVSRVIVGALVTGLAAPVHAQTCNPVETVELHASDAAVSNGFGSTVCIDGDTAIVTRPSENGSNCNGAAYIFERIGGVWTEQAQLLPDAGLGCEMFAFDAVLNGHASISNDTAIVGAVGAFDQSTGLRPGGAYIFTRSGGLWSKQATLFDGAGGTNNLFGSTVSISGDVAVVGAPFDSELETFGGAAHVFTRTGGVWTQQSKLQPADGGTPNALFGVSVSVNGNTVVIGTLNANEQGASSGSAYVFVEVGGVWIQQAKLLPAVGAVNGQFGSSVSIDGDSVLIGRPWSPNGGTAHVFTRTGGLWTEQAELNASDAESGDGFGFSVSINGDTAVIAAQQDNDNGTDSGSAYVFTRSGGLWTEGGKILASDGTSNNLFGTSASVSGNTVFVGSPWHNGAGNSAGAAYVYDISCEPGTPVCFGDGTGATCPCGNTGGSGEGCANSTGSGAVLSATGSNVVAADDLVLSASGAAPNKVGVFFQGPQEVANPFVGGILCVGGSIVRLEIVQTDGSGNAATGQSVVGAGLVSPGQTRLYQFWFRDATASCNAGSNLSGAYRVLWQ